MHLDLINLGLAIILLSLMWKRGRFGDFLKKEDVVSCSCGCGTLGYKRNFVKKIRQSGYSMVETEVFYSSLHAPKWDICRGVNTCDTKTGKEGYQIKYYKSTVEMTEKEAGVEKK